jgi:hypothetical protein
MRKMLTSVLPVVILVVSLLALILSTGAAFVDPNF